MQERPAGDDEVRQVDGGAHAGTGGEEEEEVEAEAEVKRPSLRDYVRHAWRGADDEPFELPDKGEPLVTHALFGADGISTPYRGIREALAAAATDANADGDDAETAAIKARLRELMGSIEAADQRLAHLLMFAADIGNGLTKKKPKMSDSYLNVLFEERIGEAPKNLCRMTSRSEGRRPNWVYILLRAKRGGYVGYECSAKEWQALNENVAFEPSAEESPPPQQQAEAEHDIESAQSTGDKQEATHAKAKPLKRKRRAAAKNNGDAAKKGSPRPAAADEGTGANGAGGDDSEVEELTGTPRAADRAPRRDLCSLPSYDLESAVADRGDAENPLVTSTPDVHANVPETPLQQVGTRRITRHPTDETLMKFAREALEDLKRVPSHPNKLFGSANTTTRVVERTEDGLMVRGRTLAGPVPPP